MMDDVTTRKHIHHMLYIQYMKDRFLSTYKVAT